MITLTSPIARPLAAALAGVVALAAVGAPQSVDVTFLAGFDDPREAGSQLMIGLAAAIATGVAAMLVKHWGRLIVLGSLLITVGFLVHRPETSGFTVTVAGSDGSDVPQPEVSTHTWWVALLVVGGAVVLIGVLGAAGRLVRTGATGAGLAVIGLAAAAGYLGSALLAVLPDWDKPAPRLVVLVIVTVVAAGAVLTGGSAMTGRALGPKAILLAWLTTLLPVLTTLFVAIAGDRTYDSAGGAVVCWLVLLLGLAAAAVAGPGHLLGATGAGLVLAAPAPILILLGLGLGSADGQPLWLAAVLPALAIAVVLAAWRGRLTGPVALALSLADTVLFVVLSVGGMDNAADWVGYLLLGLNLGAIMTAAAAGATAFAARDELPLLAPMVTAIAVGLAVVTDTFRLGGGGALDGSFGATMGWPAVGMLAVGAVLVAAAALRPSSQAVTTASSTRT